MLLYLSIVTLLCPLVALGSQQTILKGIPEYHMFHNKHWLFIRQHGMQINSIIKEEQFSSSYLLISSWVCLIESMALWSSLKSAPFFLNLELCFILCPEIKILKLYIRAKLTQNNIYFTVRRHKFPTQPANFLTSRLIARDELNISQPIIISLYLDFVSVVWGNVYTSTWKQPLFKWNTSCDFYNTLYSSSTPVLVLQLNYITVWDRQHCWCTLEREAEVSLLSLPKESRWSGSGEEQPLSTLSGWSVCLCFLLGTVTCNALITSNKGHLQNPKRSVKDTHAAHDRLTSLAAKHASVLICDILWML